MCSLQVSHLIFDIVIPLESASIEIATRDSNRDVAVYRNRHRSFKDPCCLPLENVRETLTVPAAVTVGPEERRGSGLLARDQEVELSEEG